MPQYKMVIDLSKCVGCGACAISCKLGNNTPLGNEAQPFKWAAFATKTEGTFPSTKWTAFPTMCNHCKNPYCVQQCPAPKTTDANCVGGYRKAMYKLTDANGGLVLHDASKCIGCGRCQQYCPYSTKNMTLDGAQYSVISKNSEYQGSWDDTDQAIADCTASPAEVADATGEAPPYKTTWSFTGGQAQGGAVIALPEIKDVREKNGIRDVVEKCTLCAHRTLDPTTPKLPYCVQACPAAARMIVGPASLKDDAGTDHAAAVYSATTQTKVLTAVPSGVKVLAHGSNITPSLVNPITSGACQPNVYYIGNFSKR